MSNPIPTFGSPEPTNTTIQTARVTLSPSDTAVITQSQTDSTGLDLLSAACDISPAAHIVNLRKKHKSWKGTHNPKLSMMLFMRESQISAKDKLLDGKPLQTNGVMKKVYNSFGFFNKSNGSWIPFNKLKDTLSDHAKAPSILSLEHRRLLFEDFVELKPGTKVLLLIQRQSPFFQSAQYLKSFTDELTANPLQPRVVDGKRYFVFEASVHANRHCDDIADGLLTKPRIAQLSSHHEGVAVRFKLKKTEGIVDFYLFDFLTTVGTNQIWGIQSMQRLALIKNVFSKSDIERSAACAGVFLDELHGDCAQSAIIIGYYQQFLAVERLKMRNQIESSNSTKRKCNLITAEDRQIEGTAQGPPGDGMII